MGRMGRNGESPVLKALVGVLIFVVFAGFYFYLAPYVSDGVGESTEETSQQAAGAEVTPDINAAVSQEEAQQSTVDKTSEYLILVNKTHGLNKAYEPDDLKKVKFAAKDRETAYQELRKTAAKAFNELAAGAKEAGHTIKLTTGYRPYSYQKVLYKQYIAMDGKNRAEQYSAKPGYSEHQTGLCADVSSPSVNYRLVRRYGRTKEGKWMAENGHRYGFIIRYPKGKMGITGYEYEPWHIRYVGTEAATEIYKQQLTLEEYLGEL